MYSSFQALRKFEPVFIYYLMVSLMTVSSVLPYCYNATNTLDTLEENLDRINSSVWYKLDARDQLDLKFLISYAQQNREITGFNFVVCSIQTFLKVKIKLITRS